MTAFWILATLMIIITVSALGLPLLKPPSTHKKNRTDYDITVYKDQLAEIERDLKRGLIGKAEVDATRIEIQRRILKAGDVADANKKITLSGSPFLAGVVGLCMTAGALGLYAYKGSPEMPNRPYANRDISAEIGAREGRLERSEVLQLTSRVLDNLRDNPDDLRGWVLLGRTYMSINDFSNALEAFRRAMELAKERPDIIAEYAEAMIMVENGTVSAQAKKIYTDILNADPRDPKALYYIGLAKAQSGDLKGALQDWVDLGQISEPSAPWMELVNKQIESIADELGVSPDTIKPSLQALMIPATRNLKQPSGNTSPLQGLSAEEMQSAQKLTPAQRQNMIQSMVERLAGRLKRNPDDLAGWQRLVRAYEVLGNREKAKNARARAEMLEKNLR